MPDFNDSPRQREPIKPLDKVDIHDRLLGQLPSFIRWLFQGRAILHGDTAKIGSSQGEKGTSCAINLKTGLWFDHHTGDKGDIFELYIANQRVTFPRALEEIASEFLGDTIPIRRAPTEKTATQRIAEAKAKLGDKPHALHLELGPPVAIWKYRDLEGNIIASAERYEPNPPKKEFRYWSFRTIDGKPRWVMKPPDLRPLYNLAGIATEGHVVLVEGEKCAEALIACGIPATTAMGGANAPILKTDWSALHGKHVTIWPDNDRAGIEYANSVAQHLHGTGCNVVVLDPRGHDDGWDAADHIAEGGAPHEFIRGADHYQNSSGFRLYSLDELENLPDTEWLVEGAIPQNSFGVLWGPSDSFKTFVAIDLALCIATGNPWHGKPVQCGPVVYGAAEDGYGVGKRMVGWRRTRGVDLATPLVHVHISGITLEEDAAALIAACKDVAPVMVVIETLARTFGGKNENATQDMNSYVNVADTIRRETGATILIIHHTGRDESKERGNLALRAACDWIMHVKRDGGTMEIDLINEPPDGKQKNAAPFPTMRLQMVETAFEYRDTEHTTLIVSNSDRQTPAGAVIKETKPARIGKMEAEILRLLEDQALSLEQIKASFDLDRRGAVHNAVTRLGQKGHIEIIDTVDGTAWRRID